MTVIYVLIGLSLLLAGGFLYAFFWSVKSGQNDDLYTPGVRILFEDKPAEQLTKKTEIKDKKHQTDGNRKV